MSENTNTSEKSDHKDNPLHWAQWLWMAPVAIALSPIGTIIGTIALRLDFMGCLAHIGAQVVGFVILYGLSNGGE